MTPKAIAADLEDLASRMSVVADKVAMLPYPGVVRADDISIFASRLLLLASEIQAGDFDGHHFSQWQWDE